MKPTYIEAEKEHLHILKYFKCVRPLVELLTHHVRIISSPSAQIFPTTEIHSKGRHSNLIGRWYKIFVIWINEKKPNGCGWQCWIRAQNLLEYVTKDAFDQRAKSVKYVAPPRLQKKCVFQIGGERSDHQTLKNIVIFCYMWTLKEPNQFGTPRMFLS